MSIIVHDVPPEISKKTVDELRSYFCCESVVIADDFDPFPLSKKQVDEFKDGTILFLTDINPEINGYHGHYNRVFPFHLAVAAAGVPSHAN